ncbi:MAG: DHH family phosphoesterase, partial [Thermoplasmata archaeon]|nr:DHH family phosphoesterase [Thermoplasmata archaeon]
FIIHGNADPDALASAFSLSSIFSGTIIAPGGLDRSSKVMAETIGIETQDDLGEELFDNLVVLDTSGPEQLGKLSNVNGDDRLIVIDHHSRNDHWKAKEYLSDDKKSSCCEIVIEIIAEAGKSLHREVALTLLGGILTDSGHFRYGNANSLITFSKLMIEYNISMHDAISIIEGKTELSEKISQLKGAQRLRFTRVDQFIIATSFGSAFEASVCRSLIQLGADLAFVGSQRGEQFRISARASSTVVDMGVHLGKILEGVGNETSNGGGGHPGAAGLSGKGNVKHMLDLCVSRSRKKLKSLISSSK